MIMTTNCMFSIKFIYYDHQLYLDLNNLLYSYKPMLDDDILNDLNDLQSVDQQQQMAQQSLSNNELNVDFGVIKKSQLLKNTQFRQHMQTIKLIVDAKINNEDYQPSQAQDVLIHKSNQYANTINKEINAIFRLVKAAYNKKFPQLQSIVTQPPLYCKAVKEIEMQARSTMSQQPKTNGSFQYLSNHQRISLEIALSSVHQKFSQSETNVLLQNVETVVQLNQDNNLLIIYLESCMQAVAPNLCQLLGSLIASKLISIAGGIKELAAIPACNIQVMGGQRSSQIGLNINDRNHTGIFGSMDIVRDAPQRFKMQLVRMLASNTAKCVRADCLKSQSGLGARLRQELYDRFQKIQEEGGLYRIDQPLPVPDQQPKKRRGGKRYRKTKELYEMSQLRKQQNRLKFGQQAQEQINDGVGLGMLSQGIGKLKVNIKKAKLNVSKKMTQRINKKSGLQSSLNLGATQGIELINPIQQTGEASGKQTIFSKSSGFQTVLNNKFGSFK